MMDLDTLKPPPKPEYLYAVLRPELLGVSNTVFMIYEPNGTFVITARREVLEAYFKLVKDREIYLTLINTTEARKMVANQIGEYNGS